MSYLNAKKLKKSRKLRKKSPRQKSTRKKSPKRKSTSKKSPKQKSSRKRRSTKQKSSRKKSAKRKTSRKKSAKRKTSRKRRSVKRKGNKKLKFRISDSKRKEIEDIYRLNPTDPETRCPICFDYLLKKEGKTVSDENIVGCMGASEIPGWTCCSKTKKTGGCKNSFFHKKCIKQWIERQESQHVPPSCPICREEKPNTERVQGTRGETHLGIKGLAAALLALNAPGLLNFAKNKIFIQAEPCYHSKVGSLRSFDGVELPACNPCSAIQFDWNNRPITYHYKDGTCGDWMKQTWKNIPDDTKKWSDSQSRRSMEEETNP